MTNRHASTIGRRHRKVSNYLLNRNFQLKYVSMSLGLSAMLSIGLGSFLVSQMRENSRMLLLDADMDAVFQEQIAIADAQSLLVLGGALLVFNILVGMGALLVTHRMAGPLFVIQRYLGMLSDSKIPEIRDLRKGDEFEDVLEAVRHTVGAVEDRLVQDLEGMQRIQDCLAGTNDADVDGALAELGQMQARKQAFLRDRN
jgi:hypothetical protein